MSGLGLIAGGLTGAMVGALIGALIGILAEGCRLLSEYLKTDQEVETFGKKFN